MEKVQIIVLFFFVSVLKQGNEKLPIEKTNCSSCLLLAFISPYLQVLFIGKKQSSYLVLLQCTFLLHVWTILPRDNGFDICNWN